MLIFRKRMHGKTLLYWDVGVWNVVAVRLQTVGLSDNGRCED